MIICFKVSPITETLSTCQRKEWPQNKFPQEGHNVTVKLTKPSLLQQ